MRSGRLGEVACSIALLTLGWGAIDTCRAADPASESQAIAFDIKPQPLGSALNAFAVQSHQTILFTPEIAKGKSSRGVRGTLVPGAALAQLLIGTGLVSSRSPEGMILVSAADAKGASAKPDPPVAPNGATNDQLQVTQASDVRPERTAQLQEVIVTGTRLSLPAKLGPLPVQVYTREDIQSSGRTTIADFLNTLPDVSVAIGENEFQNFVGQTTVRLHGLPLGTTLVLLNGRRLQSSAAGFFDLNNIPTSAVERIEVVPVGSSAVYGSDALAGAVNIILRQNLSGLEFNAKQGHAAGSDETDASLAWGTGGEQGSISLIGNFQHRNALLGQGRAVTSAVDLPTGTAYPIEDVCAPGTVHSLTGQNLPGLSSPQAAIPAGLTGKPTLTDFQATAGQVDLCNANLRTVLIPPTQRFGGMLNAHYQFNDRVDVFAEGMYTHESQEFRVGDRFGTSASFGSVMSAANPYNPFGQDVGISFADPNIPAIYNNSQTFARTLVGLRGSAFADWHYEVSGFLSRDHSEVQGTFQDLNALNAALLSPDPATAINPFDSNTPGSPQLLQSLNAYSRDASIDQLKGAQVLLRGTALELPAGPVQAVVGAEYGHEREYQASPFGRPTDLQRNSYSAFAEARIPVLTGDVQRHIADRLAVTAAARYDHSSDFGGKATYQGALEWRPADSLLLRGDYATSYQAPQLLEISGGQFESFLAGGLFDPFRGNSAVPNVPVTAGSNPDLKPENGRSQSLGVVYSSRRWEGFELSVTYFNVDIANYIETPDEQTIINNPGLFLGAVTRNPPSAQDIAQGFLGPITHINDLFFNFGRLEVSGVDADASYKLQTRLGDLTPSVAVTDTIRWNAAITPQSPTVSYLSQGTLLGPGFSPRWKGTAALAWKRGPYAASLSARYIGRYKDYQDLVANTNELGNYFLFDANLHFDLGSMPSASTRLAGMFFELGAVNLLNLLPEFSYNGTGFDPNEADIRGRFIYASVGGKW